MTKYLYPYIAKWEGGKNGNAVLFFPSADVNRGRIVSYARIGQHSEACVTYYAGLRNPKGAEQTQAVAALVREYNQHFMESNEALIQVKRDTPHFAALREAGVRNVPEETQQQMAEKVQAVLRARRK